MLQLGDLYFEPCITASQIHERVEQLGSQISKHYQDESFIALIVLKGGVVFGVDLLRAIQATIEVEFWQLQSYHGTGQSGEAIEKLALSDKLSGKNILIIEDIVDTGDTVALLMEKLNALQVKSIKIATALYKPQSFKHHYKVDFAGFEIENDFVVGYGLDYNGLGRGLRDIYKLSLG